MLFNINKQKGLALLQMAAAIFVLLSPSLMGMIPVSTGIYFMFVIFLALMCVRINTTQRVVWSIHHIIYFLLGLYAIISSIWASNHEGQLLYIFALCTLMAFHSLAGDYFAENSSEGIKRRLLYLLSISGVLCSALNIVHWIISVVPVAGKGALKQGLGTNDFLAVFMLFGITSAVLLIKGNSKLRKTMLVIASFSMLFVFIMAKSVAAWIFAVFFILIFTLKSVLKSQKNFTIISLGCVILFAVSTIIILTPTVSGKALRDVLCYSIKNPFGLGGGFWSGRELFSSAQYSEALGVGLFAYGFAASGILGLICCICVLLRCLLLSLKLKTLSSFISLLLCSAIMLLPFGGNLTIILFWIGINAYNEHVAGINFRINIKNKLPEKSVYIIATVIIIASMLLAQTLIRTTADTAYKDKNYASAYDLYKASAIINWSDSESCRKMAQSIRKSGNIQNQRDEAVHIIDKAIKRDRNNLQNLKEKALIYDACGEFELSAQQYRIASQKAFEKDSYNLLLVKELYKIVEKYPKGSSEIKRAYEEIVLIAQSTENLDYRKEINDIADKAFKFTKGELSSEG